MVIEQYRALPDGQQPLAAPLLATFADPYYTDLESA
jgi:hypothetical protein